MPTKPKHEAELEKAIANAAAQQAKATSVDEAERWQGVINQNTSALARLRSS